jgi:two-component system sensor histidine kinase MtrB
MEDAHLHGGWLQVWGEAGDGSQFRLTVPREPGYELDNSPIPLEPMDSVRRRRPVSVGDPYQRATLTPTGSNVIGGKRRDG